MLLLLIVWAARAKRKPLLFLLLLLLLLLRLSPESVRRRSAGERRRGIGSVALRPRQQRCQQLNDGAVELGRCEWLRRTRETKDKKRERDFF